MGRIRHRSKYRTPIHFLVGDRQREALLMLIANLVGEKDRTMEMGRWKVLPDFVPDDMAFEKAMLRYIYHCKDEGLAPNRTNLMRHLKMYFKDASAQFDRVIGKRTHDEDVLSHASSIGDWIGKKQQEHAISLMTEIVNDENITSFDTYGQLVAILQTIAPHSSTFETVGMIDAYREWMVMHEKNLAISRQNKIIGPRLPWRCTWDLIPYINPAEPLLFYANTGLGKTSIAVHVAEYLAHDNDDYDVLLLHFETDRKRMISRFMARELLVPVMVLEQSFYEDFDNNGNKFKVEVDLKSEKWKPAVEKVERYMDGKDANNNIRFHHCNGASLFDVEIEIGKAINRAMSRGKKLVVIVDYLQKIKWRGVYPEAIGEPQGINAISHHFKTMCENFNKINGFRDSFFAIMMAQDDPKAPRNADDVTIRGGLEPGRVFQTAVRIWREKATGDLPMLDNANEQRKNKLGAPMFYHKTGEWDSTTSLIVTKSNNGPTGERQIRMVNEYFMIASA